MDHPLPRNPWLTYFFITLVAIAFVAFLGYLWFRDQKAAERCEDLGGQTWDYGTHCVLDGTVVIDTR